MEVLKLLVALLVFAAAGCGLTRDPAALDFDERQLGVYSVLRAGADTVSVLVIRYSEKGGSFQPAFEPVAGADVRIVAGADTVRLVAELPGFRGCLVPPQPGAPEFSVSEGCYTGVLPGGVRAAARYELLVRLPTGERVRGFTQVPRPVEIVAPVANLELRPEPDDAGFVLSLRLDVPPEAGLVTLTVEALDEECLVSPASEAIGPGQPIPLGVPGADSVVVRLAGASCRINGTPVQRDSIPARLRFAAYDTAYARYFMATNGRGSVLRSRAAAGLDGALGVFAGVAIADRRIVLVPSP